MKVILIILLFISTTCYSQFHVRVEPTDEKGIVNPAWLNNYLVAYTVDNWKTKIRLFEQVDYVGYDDNGIEFFSSYYEPRTFQKLNDALQYAKQFKTAKNIISFQVAQAKEHSLRSKLYIEANKKLCFDCNDIKERIGEIVAVR